MMEFFARTQKEIFGWEGPPLHDPTTIAWLIDPGCVKTKPMRVEIELRGELAYGRTCCDFFGLENSPDNAGSVMFSAKSTLDRPSGANALVGVDVDAARFWDIVYETFAMYGK